jgi:predicted Zn-dependent protease
VGSTLEERSVPQFRLFVSLSLVTAVAACATNPVTGKREFSLMSEAQEIQLGREMDPQVRQQMGVYEDTGLQQYVERVGVSLARLSQRPALPWHFTVVDVAAVNAFALPGGYIYITRGILPYLDNEAQLAGVLGHEIGHVTARHAARQYTRATTGELGLATLGIFVPAARRFSQGAETAMGVLFLKYSREDELQADQLGVDYGSKGGWDPRGVPEMLTTLGRLDQAATDRSGVPNWLSTHPQPADRVERIQATVSQVNAGSRQWKVERAAYLQNIDGIIFGEDPRQGLVRGNDFLHPELRFAVTFPQGWGVSNSPSQVVAKAANTNVFMLLQLVQQPPGGSVADIAVANMSEAGFSRVSGSPAAINGLNAYVGTYQGTVQGLGETAVLAAHIADNGKVYLVAGLAPVQQYQQAEPQFVRSIQSFRRLTATEAAGIKPNRVQMYTARAGDTWESIAERAGNAVKPPALAIMNDHDPADRPQPGERLKIVVAG